MTPSDFEFVADLVRRKSGIVLEASKERLVQGRLRPVASRYGFRNVDQFAMALRDGHRRLEDDAIAALTTNDSWFFRDRLPFDRFVDTMLPALQKRRSRSRKIRIWCAGAAKGQEPYSLAVLLEEQRHRLSDWNFEILATDISEDMVRYAERGLYRSYEIQRGVSPARLLRHFRQEGDLWRLNWAVRRRARSTRAILWTISRILDASI